MAFPEVFWKRAIHACNGVAERTRQELKLGSLSLCVAQLISRRGLYHCLIHRAAHVYSGNPLIELQRSSSSHKPGPANQTLSVGRELNRVIVREGIRAD